MGRKSQVEVSAPAEADICASPFPAFETIETTLTREARLCGGYSCVTQMGGMGLRGVALAVWVAWGGVGGKGWRGVAWGGVGGMW